MPPARKTPVPAYFDGEEGIRKKPRHIINIPDLQLIDKGNDNKYHLMLKINKSSPEEISIKRSGNKLTVETKSENPPEEGGGSDYHVRSYEIPEENVMENLGAQLASEHLVSIRGPGAKKITGRVVPIYIDCNSQLKCATRIHLNPTDLQKKNIIKSVRILSKQDLKRQSDDTENTEKVTANPEPPAEPDSGAGEDVQEQKLQEENLVNIMAKIRLDSTE